MAAGRLPGAGPLFFVVFFYSFVNASIFGRTGARGCAVIPNMKHPRTDFPHLQRHGYEDAGFNDVLAEQLRRAPYLLASMFLHAALAFFIAGILLISREEEEMPVIQVEAAPPPPIVEDPPPPPPPIEPPTVEPAEPTLDPVDLESEPTADDPLPDEATSLKNSPFDNPDGENVLGLGGPPGGPSGGGGRGRGATPATEEAVLLGLKWLRDHQTDDGYWDSHDFMHMDRYLDQPPSDGSGNEVNDVGVTGLAMLAFLGRGNDITEGMFSQQIRAGVGWLNRMQNTESGLYGEGVGTPTLYNHSIATLAMGEAGFRTRSPLFQRSLVRAVSCIADARNPYQAWRYSMRPEGDNDTSITGWMVFALKSAQNAGTLVSKDNFDGALDWFNQMTDPSSGRTGYAIGEGGGRGGLPSRQRIYLEKFPPHKSEALTAVSLLCRIFMTDTEKVSDWKDHPDYELLRKQADLILKTPPVWDEEGGSCDMYYWYYATFAMNQWGGKHWKVWKKAIERALVPNQRRGADNFTGSWDPVGPWGADGGRVYSTAICTLILEVYYRYARVLGAR